MDRLPSLCVPFTIHNKYEDAETNRMYNLSRFLEPFFGHPFRQSSSIEDTDQATDLVLLNDDRTRLAVRFLRLKGNLTTDNFTRCTIRHEAKVGYTELEKLENNMNPNFLYCSVQATFGNHIDKVHEVVVIDMKNFKEEISPLIRKQPFVTMSDKAWGRNHYNFRWMDITPEKILFHWAENHVYVNKLNMYSWRNQLASMLSNYTLFSKYNRTLSDVTMTRWPNNPTTPQWRSLLTPTLIKIPQFRIAPALRPLSQKEYDGLSGSPELKKLYEGCTSIENWYKMVKFVIEYGDSSEDFRLHTGIC